MAMTPKKLRILVAYSMAHTHVPTTHDYLAAFSSFLDAEVDYIHVTHGAIIDLNFEEYDVVINNYCVRHVYEEQVALSFADALRAYHGVKVLIAQDEYNRTNKLKAAIRDFGFDVVLTCVPAASLEYVYPRDEFPNVTFETVLTGYVPDRFIAKPISRARISGRPIVVGYRGRCLPAYYGRLGFEKYEIGRRMREYCQARAVPHDIEMSETSRIYGTAWFEFLASCRSMLGTEFGSNVFDFDGSIERAYDAITASNGGRPPSFTEFAPAIAAHEREISMEQISPRVFECAVTRTPMVFFRGAYSGLIEPATHYIALEKDFSNVDEVFERLQDAEALEFMADRAYLHLVESGTFSYAEYMKKIQRIIAEVVDRKSRSARTFSGLGRVRRSGEFEVPTRSPRPGFLWPFKEAQTAVDDHLKVCGEIKKDIAGIMLGLPDNGKSAKLLQEIEQLVTYIEAFKARTREWYLKYQSVPIEPSNYRPATSVGAAVDPYAGHLRQIRDGYEYMSRTRAMLMQTLAELTNDAALERLRNAIASLLDSCAYLEKDVASISLHSA